MVNNLVPTPQRDGQQAAKSAFQSTTNVLQVASDQPERQQVPGSANMSETSEDNDSIHAESSISQKSKPSSYRKATSLVHRDLMPKEKKVESILLETHRRAYVEGTLDEE